ncbi:hypothetical protein diail_10913 [Diaporthe ilicicola]|nr:hypothetical protein diail_10913 [Diaporthe ilicicola]
MTGSCSSTASSSSFASSFDSVLFDDSYLKSLKPVDEEIKEMMADIKVLENKRRLFDRYANPKTLGEGLN